LIRAPRFSSGVLFFKEVEKYAGPITIGSTPQKPGSKTSAGKKKVMGDSRAEKIFFKITAH
jgi:hypothetical protein